MAKNTAHELPTGRLASFEDDDDDLGSMADILGPRRSRVAPVPDPVDAPTSADDQVDATPEPPPASAATPPTKRQRRTKTEIAAKAGQAEAPGSAANEIRSSSIHIPTSLLERLVAFREGHGMSNGQVVIAAIEGAHPRLGDLINPGTAGGGGLFAQRATRGVRTNDGPLTPLNVRLFAADYDVMDQLVEKFGAYSRGHLVTVCLTAFFEEKN